MSAIRKNLLSLLASQLATWAVSILILVRVPEILGEEQFGVLVTATAFVGFFALVAGFGTPTLMTREIARDHSLSGPYIVNAFLLKLVLIAALSVVAISLALLLDYSGTLLTLIVIGCLGMACSEINGDFVGALGGMERMARSSFLGVVQVYVGSLVGLAILASGGGLVAYGVVLAIATVIPLVANGILVWPYARHSLHVDFDVWKLLLRGGTPLLVLAAFNLIYGTIDIPLLNAIAGEATVGWYGLAYKWVGIPIFISTAVVVAFFPRFSALGKSQDPEFAPQVNRAILLVTLVAVPAAVGLGVAAEPLLSFFYSQQEFSNSIVLMQILAVHIPIAAVDTIVAMSLIAIDRQNRYVLVAATAAILNPIACVIAINWAMDTHDNGAIGAAIVTVATELLILSLALTIRPRGVMDRATLGTCARIVAAGVLMGEVVLLADDLPLVAIVAIGVVVYAAASLLFGTITVSDVRRVVGAAAQAVRSVRGRGGPEHAPPSEPEGGDETPPQGVLAPQPWGRDPGAG